MSVQNVSMGYVPKVQLGNLLTSSRINNPQSVNEPFNFSTAQQTGGFNLNYPNNKVEGLRCDAFDYLA